MEGPWDSLILALRWAGPGDVAAAAAARTLGDDRSAGRSFCARRARAWYFRTPHLAALRVASGRQSLDHAFRLFDCGDAQRVFAGGNGVELDGAWAFAGGCNLGERCVRGGGRGDAVGCFPGGWESGRGRTAVCDGSADSDQLTCGRNGKNSP